MSIFILASIAAIVVLPAIFAFILRWLRLPLQAKKWIFAGLSAFFGFIVMIPVPNFFVMPMPNAIALIGMIVDPYPSGGLSLPQSYLAFWQFALPSFLFFVVMYRGVAIFIFGKKPLPNKQNQPI